MKCCWPDGEQANEGVNKMNIIAVKLQGMDKKSKRKITTPCSLPSTPLLNMDGKWRVWLPHDFILDFSENGKRDCFSILF